MQYHTFSKPNVENLEEQVQARDAVRHMRETDGWKIVQANLEEQLQALVADNATHATSWDDYQKKAGKIYGIQLLLVGIEEFESQGNQAAEELHGYTNQT